MNVAGLARIGAAMLTLVLTAAAPVAARLPRVTWRGTILLSDSRTGSLVAHTRLLPGPPNGEGAPEYNGRFRCHGPGCPFRRGRIFVEPAVIGTDRIRVLTFDRPRREAQCTYYSVAPPADLAISGPFQCVGPNFAAQGSISLTATRRP